MPSTPTPPPFERLQAEADALRASLEMLVSGEPIPKLLERLCLLLESLIEEGTCSILTATEDGLHIQHEAGPSIPRDFLRQIDGQRIGPEAGSCGSAMWHRRTVVTEDIASDPRWIPYRSAAEAAGLGACASVPILDAAGGLLGSFAIYHDAAGPFSAEDLALLERFTTVAALAIQARRREVQLGESQARYRALVEQSPDAIFTFEPESLRILEANDAFCAYMGYTQAEMGGLTLYDLVAHDRESVQANIRQTLELRQRFLGIRMYRRKDGSFLPVEVSAAIVDLGGRPIFSVIARDVSDRQKAEEALRQSQARLMESQRIGRLGHWSFDLATQRIEWSPEIYRIFRRDPDLGPPDYETYMAYFCPEEQQALKARVGDAIQRAEAQDFDVPLHWPDGTITWHRGIIQPELESGQVVRLVGIAQDITDRKKAEEALSQSEAALRHSERIFREMFEASPVPLALTRSHDGVVLMANEVVQRMFGVDETVIGTAFALKVYQYPEDRERFLEALRREGSLRDFEVTLITAQGPSRLLVSARLIPWEGGEAILLGYTDITERLRQEVALRKSEATFRHLFDTTPVPLVLSKPADGTILLANPSAYRMFELTPEEVVHHRTVEFFANPQSRDELLRLLRASGRAEDFDLDMVVHGLPRRVLVSAAILHYQGEPAIMVALTDITERQREEESQRQAQKLESLGVLAGGIAHDFNNLLTAILGNLNLAQLHMDEGHPSVPYLHDMEAVVQRAADLARQMLAYSGRGRFRLEPVDLNLMVREMAHLLSIGVSKKVQLHLELEQEIPSLEGDPVQIQQVIMNLVTNASEAIGDREGAIRLRTGLATLSPQEVRLLRLGQDLPAGDYLCLEVEDTGAGMDRDTLARIFDPFFTTKAAGRGLGLSAMLGILRGHHAGLSIRTEPGLGSCFSLYFTPMDLPEPLPAAPRPDSHGKLHGRVLVVDDEGPVRLSAAHMLAHLGMEVEEAEDGEEGVAKVRQAPDAWSCVLLDLTMPRMDGNEALRQIRALRPDLPVILSSGYSDQAALAFDGPGTFLAKPYHMEELREALAKVINSA